MKRFLITIFAAATCTAAFAQTPAPREAALPETVSVTGTGKATLIPDRYTFSVGVQTVAMTVDDAVRENNQKTADVIAALKKAGATEKEIRTTNFSIWPQQDYSNGKTPRITGYQVSNNVVVTRDKVGDAGKLLQAAIGAGVNVASGLSFEVSNPARGRDEGLRAAFADAKSKASVLAQAAGRSLGRVLSLTEGGAAQAPPPYMRAMAAKAEAQSDVPVEAGTQELSFTVSVIFELR